MSHVPLKRTRASKVTIWYAVLENTAPVQGIRCEPSGEHLIPWRCAVFFHTARKLTPFVFSHTIVQNFQRRKKVYSWPTWQTTIRPADVQLIAFTAHLLYSMHTTCWTACWTAECGIGWSRYTSHSGNTTSECEYSNNNAGEYHV